MRRVWWVVALAAALLAVAEYVGLRARAAAQRTDTAFYGSEGLEWGPSAVAEADPVGRRIPLRIDGPGSPTYRPAQALILPFHADPGRRLRVLIGQFENPSRGAPVLRLSLNGGQPVEIATRVGTGMDPYAIEHGARDHYEASLPGLTRCGRNQLTIEVAKGAWTAIERIDVQVDLGRSLSFHIAARVFAAVALLLAGAAFIRRARMAQVALVAGGVAVGLILAEASVRLAAQRLSNVRNLLYSSTDAASAASSSGIIDAMRGHRCAPGPCSMDDGGFRNNRNGFHTHDYARTKPRGVTRVVGLGDSFMRSGGPVPHAGQFFSRLDAGLRQRHREVPLEFINLGFSCIGIPTEIALLQQEALALSPDLVVWTIYLGNDLTDEQDVAPAPVGAPSVPVRTAAWHDRSLALRFVRHVWQLFNDEPQRLVAGCEPLPRTTSADTRCGSLERADIPYDATAKTYSDSSYAQFSEARIAGLYARNSHDSVRVLADRLVARMRTIRPLLTTTPAVVAIIPDELQVSPQVVSDVLLAAPSVERPLDQNLQYSITAVGNGLREAGFLVVDLAPAFREAIAAGMRIYQPNDTHFSLDGNRIAAEVVARFIEEQRLLR
jgi:hypothetical protein